MENIDDQLDELEFDMRNNMKLDIRPIDQVNTNITLINEVARCTLNKSVINNFIVNYEQLYEGLLLDGISDQMRNFLVINLNAWEHTGQLLYAYNILYNYSRFYKDNSIDVPYYIEPLMYPMNEISERINKIVLLEDAVDSEINEHIDSLFKHYLTIITNLKADTILSINIVEFLFSNINLWYETKQIIFAYNVMNNVSELLYSGSSSIIYLPMVSLT